MSRMGKKPMTVAEMASKGGRARARKYSRDQLRDFAKNAGRRPKLSPGEERRILALVDRGWTHPDVAAKFGISPRTVGRIVARNREEV